MSVLRVLPPVSWSARLLARMERATLWEQMAESSLAVADTPPAFPAPLLTVWDRRYGHRGERFQLPLAEALTPQMREAFLHGHCHSLALAFHEHGFHVYGIVSVHAEEEFVPVKSAHFFAVDPQVPDVGWDVDGCRPIAEIAAVYGDVRTYRVEDPHALFALLAEEGVFLPVDVEAGRTAYAWVVPSN